MVMMGHPGVLSFLFRKSNIEKHYSIHERDRDFKTERKNIEVGGKGNLAEDKVGINESIKENAF